MILSPPPLWTPRRRVSPLPDLRRWRRSVPLFNMAAPGKVQRNTSGRINRFRDGPNAGKMVRNRDSGTTCCCGPQAEWTQFRKCTDGTLAPLWGLPDDPDQTFPWTMWYKGDKKCYYRDGTEPTSTSPVGTIIYPAYEPTWIGDYYPLPISETCTSGMCNPTPCSSCSGRTPWMYTATVSGCTIDTSCIFVDEATSAKAESLTIDGTYPLYYQLGGTCAWGFTLIGQLTRTAFNDGACTPSGHDPTDADVVIGCDINGTVMRAYIGDSGSSGFVANVFYGEAATHDCMSAFSITNEASSGFYNGPAGLLIYWANGGSITLTPGPPMN